MVNDVLINVLDKAVNGFILLDLSLNIVFVNSFLLNTLENKSIIGHNIFEVFPQIKSTRIQECIHRARDKKDSSIVTHSLNKNQFPIYSRSQKEQMKQNIYIHPITEEKNTKYILIQILDETLNVSKESLLREKTLKEQSLNQALKDEIIQKTEYQKLLLSKKAEIEEANRVLLRLDSEKNEFLGMVAHDLRNPLSIIRAIAEDILSESKDMMDIREGLALIAQTSASMIRLVTDLLDSHTIESGKLASKAERINLTKVINSRIEILKMQAYRKRIFLETKLELYRDEYILDSRCFVQVLDNYLSNAVKFSGIDTTVLVHVFETENKIICEVKDQGPGLTTEDQTKIFQKFSRLTPRPTAGEKSNGLGLFISKKMAELAGGEVWISSIPGQGSTFGLSLPYLPEFRAHKEISFHSEGRVLLVDDEEIIQKIFATQVMQIDHPIDLASDTETAIELLQKKNYDFVFVDKHLGNESGDIALNKFKEKNPYKHTKYILCSGDVTPANRDSFLALGFDDAIPKDFHLETIRSILDEF